jgi:carbon-monoxide dehydrogenase large subunit
VNVTLARPIPRFEDDRFIQGKGRYTDDIAPADVLWAIVVRSPHAHARIDTIQIAAAATMPGVAAVLTAADYAADGLLPIPHAANPPDAHDVTRPWFVASNDTLVREWRQPPLAVDRVRFVGEAVVLIVAETLAAARDAAEAVEVVYESLPAVSDGVKALAEGAPLLWEDAPGNLALSATLGDRATVDATFATATLVVENSFHNQRIVNCQMEPRAAFASYDPDQGFTVVAGSQGVLRQRSNVAAALGEPPDRVRMMSPDVGGGFGPRTPLNVEPVLVAWAAKRLGRSVRWISDRTEAFLTDFQARDQWTTAAIAFDADGRIRAMRSQQTFNLGAYPVSFAPAGNGQRIVPTAYVIPDVWVETFGALSNTVPTAPYRGAGRPEAHLAIERLLDMAANRLGLDRIEIRRRNLVPRSRMPYTTATGLVYDSGDFLANMTAALAVADWDGCDERRKASRAVGRLRGIGVANYVESPVGAATETVILRILRDGHVDMITGTQSTGQGHETTFVQIAAAMLELPHNMITLRTGDTAFVKSGGGSHSDRSARLLGALLDRACPALLQRGREAASLLLNVPAQSLEYKAARFVTEEGRCVTLAEIAAAFSDGFLPTQLGSSFEVSETIAKRIPAHPTGCAICEVEVDPDTGTVEVVRYSSVDDVGQPINPLVVDGQVHGGIAQGVGQALYEGVTLDPTNGQVLSASYMDCGLPRADNLPSFAVSLAEDPTTNADNRFRIKGGGEGGITPATAAVMNALVDALSPLGIDHVEMPATPARVWALIQRAKPARKSGS